MKFYQISTKDPGNIFLKWKMLRETTTNDLEVKSSLQLPYNWADKDTCGLEQLIRWGLSTPGASNTHVAKELSSWDWKARKSSVKNRFLIIFFFIFFLHY